MKEGRAKEEQDTLNAELQGQAKEKSKLERSLKDQQEEVAEDSNSKERAKHELPDIPRQDGNEQDPQFPANDMSKMTQDAKKDEFRKYLEKTGVLELLTKSLVQLYEETEKPTDALGYLKDSVGGSQDDKKVIAQLREKNDQLKAKVKETEASQSSLESHLKALQEGTKSPEPSEEKVAATKPAAEAVTAAAETGSEDSEEAMMEKPTEEKLTPKEVTAEAEPRETEENGGNQDEQRQPLNEGSQDEQGTHEDGTETRLAGPDNLRQDGNEQDPRNVGNQGEQGTHEDGNQHQTRTRLADTDINNNKKEDDGNQAEQD